MLLISKIFRNIFGEQGNTQEHEDAEYEELKKLYAFSDELNTQAEIMKGIVSLYSSMDKLGDDEMSIRKIYLN